MTQDLENEVAEELDYVEGWNEILCCWFPLPELLEAEAKPDTPLYTLAGGYRPQTNYIPEPPITP